MRFYEVLIRLSGSLHNEVRKYNVSAAEVLVINALHGGGAVVEQKQTAEKEWGPRDHRRHRVELMQRYGRNDISRSVVESIIGIQVSATLPTSVSDDDLKGDEDIMLEEVEDEAPEKEPETTKSEPPAATKSDAEKTKEAKAAVRQSLSDLGWSVPKTNASLKELRAELRKAQDAEAKKADAELAGDGVL